MFTDSITFDGQFYSTDKIQYVETRKIKVDSLVTIQDNGSLFCKA